MDLVIRNGISDTTYEPIEVSIQSGKIVSVARDGLPTGEQEIDATAVQCQPGMMPWRNASFLE